MEAFTGDDMPFSRRSPYDDAEDDNSSYEPGTKGRGSKRPMTDGMKSRVSTRKVRKNDREKQRRSQLNNQFEVWLPCVACRVPADVRRVPGSS